jgi:outer membrane lipoprotein LolB
MTTRRGLTLAMAALALAGCAQVPRSSALPDAPVRSGRLALSVPDQPAQSFSAAFELRGRADAGELTLFNPIGGTLALMQWQPGTAQLSIPGRAPQQFPSVEAMVEQATGAPIPLAALFDWLGGTNTPVPGWQADLSRLADGMLRAQRLAPPPQADLRVVLDR